MNKLVVYLLVGLLCIGCIAAPVKANAREFYRYPVTVDVNHKGTKTVLFGYSQFYSTPGGGLYANRYNRQTIRDFAALLSLKGVNEISLIPAHKRGGIPKHLRALTYALLADYGIWVQNHQPYEGRAPRVVHHYEVHYDAPHQYDLVGGGFNPGYTTHHRYREIVNPKVDYIVVDKHPHKKQTKRRVETPHRTVEQRSVRINKHHPKEIILKERPKSHQSLKHKGDVYRV